MKLLPIVLSVVVCTAFFSFQTAGAKLSTSTRAAGKTHHKLSEYRNKLRSLDSYVSDKPLGVKVSGGSTAFALFAPQAVSVSALVFTHPADETGSEYPMSRDSNGVWEVTVSQDLTGRYYGFSVNNPGDSAGMPKAVCLDPYAKAVTTYNTYLGPRRGIITSDDRYDWQGTAGVPRDWRDLVVYEMHVRDMTAHSSAGAKQPGTYMGLIEKGITGGINYIKKLGVNTVELLPSQEFANIELPFQKSLLGRVNTWNPYERNHWGYMTAAFFAPEAYYAENWKQLQWNTWEGQDGRQVKAFKDMVRAFHKENITVIMDVVFNHLSEYELGNLKEIDKEYYFRLDDKGNYIAQSGCGNDLKTERPMVRRMIIESIIYWMKEYHVDGFRFDLGKLIDWETLEDIIFEAKKINPNVIFVAEPWGGGYDPAGFSLRGWGSWNDQIRNGVKGENPVNGRGWIFGEWYGNNNPRRIKSYVHGTLTRDTLGLFQKKEHSVNYLESHDGYTLGDFIRLGTREVNPEVRQKDINALVKLSPFQAKLNKLGALFLFTAQGITMIHAGQEYARSKVIAAQAGIRDSHAGMIDHNSYEKDNETNYLNYGHVKINKGLFDYYRGLIALRGRYPAFRRAEYNDITFFDIRDNQFALGYQIKHAGETFLVLLNANPTMEEPFTLPAGEWEILVNPAKAGVKPLGKVTRKIVVETTSGYVLRKK